MAREDKLKALDAAISQISMEDGIGPVISEESGMMR